MESGAGGAAIRRLVSLWLTLLGAYWLTRAGASALLWGRVDGGFPAALELAVVPALQALALGWATREQKEGERESGALRAGAKVEERRRTRQAGLGGAGAAGPAGEADGADGEGSG